MLLRIAHLFGTRATVAGLCAYSHKARRYPWPYESLR